MSDPVVTAKNEWALALSNWQEAVSERANGSGTQEAVDSAYSVLWEKEVRYIAAARAGR